MDIEVFDTVHAAVLVAEALEQYKDRDSYGPRIKGVEARFEDPIVILTTRDGSEFAICPSAIERGI